MTTRVRRGQCSRRLLPDEVRQLIVYLYLKRKDFRRSALLPSASRECDELPKWSGALGLCINEPTGTTNKHFAVFFRERAWQNRGQWNERILDFDSQVYSATPASRTKVNCNYCVFCMYYGVWSPTEWLIRSHLFSSCPRIWRSKKSTATHITGAKPSNYSESQITA